MWRINTWELPEEESQALLLQRLAVPDLPEVRRRAQRKLAEALDEVLAPKGYERIRAGLWVKSGVLVQTYVELQKGRRGYDCHINVGREKARESTIPSHKSGATWRLGEFAGSTAGSNRIDSLYYYDLDTDPEFIPFLMGLLSKRALPFLAVRRLIPPLHL